MIGSKNQKKPVFGGFRGHVRQPRGLVVKIRCIPEFVLSFVQAISVLPHALADLSRTSEAQACVDARAKIR